MANVRHNDREDEDQSALRARAELDGVLDAIEASDPGQLASVEARAEPTAPTVRRVSHFRLDREVGRGGQASVWRAWDEQVKRWVAVKLFPVAWEDTESFLRRSRREAELLGRLDHPSLCRIHAAGVEDGRPWIALGWVEGETLAAVLARDPIPRSTAALMDRVLFIEKAARALQVAHDQGILHRDLKPGNLMVRPDEEPVILDLGLASDLRCEPADRTRSGAVFGTPAYMAPEQFRGAVDQQDARSDVWALGATLFRSVTGSGPHDGATVEQLQTRVLHDAAKSARLQNPAVPRDLDIVLATALATEPDRRYRSALEFANDLRAVRTGEAISARPERPIARWWRAARRDPRFTLALLAVFGLLAAGLWISHSLLRESEKHRSTAEARYHRLLQTSHRLRAADLLARAESLSPILPSLVQPCEAWLEEARALLGFTARHEETLADLRRRRLSGEAAPEEAWFESLIAELLTEFAHLRTVEAEIRTRAELAASLHHHSVERHAQAWSAAEARILESERYGFTEFRSIVGLVPLGESPRSGLFEFSLHLSGDPPSRRDERGEWALDENTGVILVLLAGGETDIGVAKEPDVPHALPESPAWRLTLAPFLISKYELTQAQWKRLSGGDEPSRYRPGSKAGETRNQGPARTLLHPVESVSHTTSTHRLRRWNLDLPTEAQWEYASGAGGADRVVTTSDLPNLHGRCNLAGKESPVDRWLFGAPPLFDDGFVHHSPVGSFLPNSFGLFDTLGNVHEWCRDQWFRTYEEMPFSEGTGERHDPRASHPLRCVRGGSFWSSHLSVRTTFRNYASADQSAFDVGIRPVWNLTP